MSRHPCMTKIAILLAAYACCSAGNSVCAQATVMALGGENEMPAVKVSSVPQAEPDPPLKYQLIPAYGKLTPGNAATGYYRAIVLLPRDEKHQFGDEQSKWIEVPLGDFPKEEARTWLAAHRNMLEEVRTATFREDCDWSYRMRELKGMETISYLLPEMQEARAIARALRVKSRLEIAEGKFDEALQTITCGYRLGENVARTPILINDLVGIAIAGQMNASVLDWIESGGPNLYWGLAGLPNPLVDIRLALQQEANLPVQIFPFLEDPEHATHTAEEWRQLMGQAIQQLAQLSDSDKKNTSSNLLVQSMATGLFLAGYPSAKQQLIDSGMDAANVEAMPVGQVVAVQSARAYRKVYQESMKWTLLPYWQSYRQMRATFADLQRKGYMGAPGQAPAVLPVADALLPAIEAATFAPVRLQREIAALQTIEALRMFAANNNGQLPESLEQLQPCPAPLDPLTGKFIDYQRKDGSAVLTLPPPEGRTPQQAGKRYELRFRN